MDKRADKSDLRETDKGSLLVVFNNYDKIVIKSINTERKKDKWELHLSRTRKPRRR